jgi:Peptidase_C39 like family
MAVIAGVSVLGWWAAIAAPAASAGTANAPLARQSIARQAVRAASAGPAPLVRDATAAPRGKHGLAAPAMSSPMLSANAKRQFKARKFLRLLRQNVTADIKCSSRACRTGLPAARNLKPTQQAQVRGYYCGPATVSEMLAQMGKQVSQVTAARELNTNPSGTNWSDDSGYPVPDVLNMNQKKNDYVAVALPWSPTSAQVHTFETDLVTDVNHDGGVPIAGNAYEVAGGPHLAGNPVSQTIFHWFDIRGYKNFGAVTDYEDSVHGASSIGWSAAVPAYSSMATTAIVDILGARGYDW